MPREIACDFGPKIATREGVEAFAFVNRQFGGRMGSTDVCRERGSAEWKKRTQCGVDSCVQLVVSRVVSS